MTTRSQLGLAILAALSLGAGACGDPVIDAKRDALGDEVEGVEPGPYHRPGQPCLLCHGPFGSDEPRFSVAGTIHATPTNRADKDPKNDAPVPVADVNVTLTDSFGKTHVAKTNCIGNFYVETKDYDPGFPLRAEIEYPVPGQDGVTKRVVMATRIERDGSCAGCHTGDRGPTTPGWVTCTDAPTTPFKAPDASCPGVP
jgi:hypothetical protein